MGVLGKVFMLSERQIKQQSDLTLSFKSECGGGEWDLLLCVGSTSEFPLPLSSLSPVPQPFFEDGDQKSVLLLCPDKSCLSRLLSICLCEYAINIMGICQCVYVCKSAL